MISRAYDAVVIGAGVVGLAAAWHLLRLGRRSVAVVERFRVGHDRGSSHGSVRMTRSTYSSAAYAALMRHVHAEEWPRLERDAGVALVHRGDVLFFGDRAALGDYAAAVLAAGADVEPLVPAVARRRFPAFRFADDSLILHDRTGGVIAAADTIRALRRLVEHGGAEIMEETRVLEIDRRSEPIRVVSERGDLHADRVVIAAGAWLPELMPAVAPAIRVVPQTVAYFRLGAPVAPLPAWVHFGGGERSVVYGLAERGREVLKAAHHDTRGVDAPPDAVPPPPVGESDAVRRLLERILAVPVLELLGVERCLYAMTPTEDFAIDHWPGDPRVAFASACSGHGFKFAPLTGRLLAELVVNGRADLPGNPDSPALFALRR